MPHTPKKTVNMKVPPQMVGELQNYLAQLQVQHEAEAACSNMAVEESESEPEMCEVRRVQHHKISTAGQWSFLVNFTDGSKEWVDDVKCHCAVKISEYMRGKGTTAHLVCRVSTKEQASSTATSFGYTRI